jgi:dTDP-4-dehydrorhamnose 3,5-epimerase
MPITFESTPIGGLTLASREVFSDARGSFSRLFGSEEFSQPCDISIVQINHSVTRAAGSVRGMHFQFLPHDETKIVTCLFGEVFDVAVDLRAASPTFLHWHGVNLNGDSLKSFVIPPGVAHGFQVLSEEARLVYFHSKSYQPKSEGRVHPLDPAVKIAWPLPVINLSARDSTAPFLPPDYVGIQVSG